MIPAQKKGSTEEKPECWQRKSQRRSPVSTKTPGNANFNVFFNMCKLRYNDMKCVVKIFQR